MVAKLQLVYIILCGKNGSGSIHLCVLQAENNNLDYNSAHSIVREHIIMDTKSQSSEQR